MQRRSLFKKLAAVGAVLAIAPTLPTHDTTTTAICEPEDFTRPLPVTDAGVSGPNLAKVQMYTQLHREGLITSDQWSEACGLPPLDEKRQRIQDLIHRNLPTLPTFQDHAALGGQIGGTTRIRFLGYGRPWVGDHV